jgi:hypothetical protein
MTDQRHRQDTESDWQYPFRHREALASNLSSRGACDVAIQQQSLRRGSPVFAYKNVNHLKFYFIYASARNIKTKY